MSSSANQGSDEASKNAEAKSKGAGLAIAAALIGSLVTGVLTAGVLLSSHNSSSALAGVSDISTVAAADLGAAGATLAPAQRAALLSEAKACHTPLAVVTLNKAAGAAGGMIRIRSGAYLSPAFRVEDVAQKIAIPFPTAYDAGRGTISVEGAATGVQLTLYPTQYRPKVEGTSLINIWWYTDKPCGG